MKLFFSAIRFYIEEALRFVWPGWSADATHTVIKVAGTAASFGLSNKKVVYQAVGLEVLIQAIQVPDSPQRRHMDPCCLDCLAHRGLKANGHDFASNQVARDPAGFQLIIPSIIRRISSASCTYLLPSSVFATSPLTMPAFNSEVEWPVSSHTTGAFL
jgi:hypothetical protein